MPLRLQSFNLYFADKHSITNKLGRGLWHNSPILHTQGPHLTDKKHDGTQHHLTQIAKFLGSTWGPPGSCRPQMGPMLAPSTLLSGLQLTWKHTHIYILAGIRYITCKTKHYYTRTRGQTIQTVKNESSTIAKAIKDKGRNLSSAPSPTQTLHSITTAYLLPGKLTRSNAHTDTTSCKQTSHTN